MYLSPFPKVKNHYNHLSFDDFQTVFGSAFFELKYGLFNKTIVRCYPLVLVLPLMDVD
jgi:hypothetical protein